MKTVIAAAAMCLSLALSNAPAASAQTRTRRTQPARRAPARPSTPGARLDQTQTNAARIKLADQVKNLARFVYLYGRFSKDLENVSAQAESAEVASRTKAALLTNFRNFREGLDGLERDFRFTPGLSRHYGMLQGAAQKVSDAEAQANANQYDRAGRLLLEVVNQLTDVLIEM
ncbi:MAG: hypothetical protein LC800_22420 [Acidobacteria bacterium]|nr:hypothetical protein [Acidobacteriota bacterium]